MSKNSPIKRISKYIKKSLFLHSLVQYSLYFLLKILFKTYRLKVITKGNHINEGIPSKNIYYFWHQSIISGMYFFHKKGLTGNCIVSPSKDGKIAGFICKKLGFEVLYGSSYKQPITVLKKMIPILKGNNSLCIVGDGSRGPAFILQQGIVRLSEKSNTPTVFIECKPSSCFTLKKSWDQFQIPYPFSTITITVHQPSHHPIIKQ